MHSAALTVDSLRYCALISRHFEIDECVTFLALRRGNGALVAYMRLRACHVFTLLHDSGAFILLSLSRLFRGRLEVRMWETA
jgi:hypothetical protein